MPPSVASDDGTPARVLPRDVRPCPLKKKSKADPLFLEDGGCEEPPVECLLKKKSTADPLFSEDGGCEEPPAEHLSSPAIEYIFLLLYFYLTDLVI